MHYYYYFSIILFFFKNFGYSFIYSFSFFNHIIWNRTPELTGIDYRATAEWNWQMTLMVGTFQDPLAKVATARGLRVAPKNLFQMDMVVE